MSAYVNQAFKIVGVKVKQSEDSIILKYKRSSEKVANFLKNDFHPDSQRSIKDNLFFLQPILIVFIGLYFPISTGFKHLFNSYNVIKHESSILADIATIISMLLPLSWFYMRIWLATTKIEVTRGIIKINGKIYHKLASSSFRASEIKKISSSVLNQPYVLLEYQNGDRIIPLSGMLKEQDAEQIVQFLNKQLV